MLRRASAGSPALPLLQSVAFVSTLDRFVMPPMLVVIAASLDVDLADVVTAAGAYFLTYGLMQPVWGVVSDRFGRVRTLRSTLLAAGLCSVASAAAPGLVALTVARALAGACFGAAYPSTLIYVGDTVPAAKRQRDIAGLMVGVAAGTALASIAAGLVADIASWRLMFLLTGAAALLLAMILRRLPEPTVLEDLERVGGASGGTGRTVRGSIVAVARKPVVLFVLALAFAEGVVLLGGLTLLPPAVENGGATATTAGLVTGVYGLSVFAGARLVGVLAPRVPSSALIAGGATMLVLACSTLAVSRAPVVAAVAAALLGLAWTSMHSTLQTWATQVLPAERATVVSFFASSLFVGSALTAAVVAGLADAGRFSLIFLGGALLAVPLGCVATWGRRRW